MRDGGPEFKQSDVIAEDDIHKESSNKDHEVESVKERVINGARI